MRINDEAFFGCKCWFHLRPGASLSFQPLSNHAQGIEKALKELASNLLSTFIALVVMLGFTAHAAAQDAAIKIATTPKVIYEWTDDTGRKHAADAVPEKYRGAAKRLDPTDYRISPGEQAEAERRSAALQEQAAAIVTEPAPVAIPDPSLASNRLGEAKRPSAAECLSWRRRYAASQDCFVGTVSPLGKSTYRSCANEYVADPEPVCGR